jgi:hypothetical protein
MFKGLGWIKGKISPHYGARMLDFDKIVCYNYGRALAVEDNAAIVIEDGEVVGSITSGGNAYWLLVDESGKLTKEKI